jgi:hypothetical protein
MHITSQSTGRKTGEIFGLAGGEIGLTGWEQGGDRPSEYSRRRTR